MRRFTYFFYIIDLRDFFGKDRGEEVVGGGGGGVKIKINWKISLKRSNKSVCFCCCCFFLTENTYTDIF